MPASNSNSTRPRWPGALGIGTLSLALWTLSCDSSDAAPPGLDLGTGLPSSMDSDPCATPNTACDCSTPGQVVDCGTVYRETKEYISCSVGRRTCGADGKWGTCVGDQVTQHPLSTPKKRSTFALGPSEKCSTNKCDPYCHSFTDTSTGVIAPGLDATDGLAIERKDVEETDEPCEDLLLAPETTTVVVTNIASGASSGLLGEYFSQQSQSVSQIPSSWTAMSSRVDANIDFALGSGSPGITGVGADNFSIRWTGAVTADATGTYRFATYSDDGIRLWVDGTLLIDRWVYQSPTWVESASFTLSAASSHDIRVEYFEAGGGAHVQLYWQHPDRGWEVVPETAFTPPGSGAQGFTTIPEKVDFSASLTPATCYDGEVEPLFSLNRFDSAYISPDGRFQVYAPVAGELDVSAYLGEYVRTAKAEVIVDVLETDLAPVGAVTNHAKPPSGTDPAKFLYPYANTVFPLALAAPVIQYDTAGTSASSVKYTLRYPAIGEPIFEWSRIVSEPASPRLAIPEYAWNALEKTAKGQDAALVIQRVVGTTPRQELVRPIRFATAPLRGKIYYTQYGRNGSTKLMVADPTSSSPARDAFAGGSDGCPVCHSVSAQGNVFATTNRGFSSQGGLSSILSSGLLSPTEDHPGGSPYDSGSDDFRGFAWSPLTPDGKYALQANNIHGNTIQQVVGIDTATDTVDVPETFLSGGNGTGLLAEFFSGMNFSGRKWKKFTPHLDYAYSSSSGPGGPIGNSFSARFSGQIMAYASETYTFSLVTRDGVRLTVEGNELIDDLTYSGGVHTVTGQVALAAGQKTDIDVRWRDANGPAHLEMYWSSPSTPFSRVPVDMLFPNDGLHGVEADYYNTNDFGSLVRSSFEPNIDHDWGSGAQPGVNANNHSTIWTARLEAPISGNIRLCLRSDDDGRVEFDGTTVIDESGSVDACSNNLSVFAGNLYDVSVTHREFSGNSNVELSWESNSFSREVISPAYFYPPTSYTVPTTGLQVTYYDGDFFTSSQEENPSQDAFTTFVDTIDETWNGGRPNYSLLTSNDTFSARWVGTIDLPCDGIYEFRSTADDASSLYIGDSRVAHLDRNGTVDGAAYFEAGTYDFKYQFQETGGWASAHLYWIPRCLGETSFQIIPSARFSPSGGTASAGLVRRGGDNGNRTGYYVWETAVEEDGEPVDVTGETPGRWGLGTTAMMVPSFAPDSSKLVFVDGDSSGGAGWRKGLSIFDFDQTGKLFKGRRNILNTWPYGDVVKWPVFESDSRTVLYNATTPVDWCCKGGWTQYGHMAPTNYFEIPGRLFTIDSEAEDPQPAELKILNEGERNIDANKAYQATMLPTAVAGYRWVVFTSTRPYGNTFNTGSQNDYSDPASFTPMVNNSNLQSMLWISAIDDAVSESTDRSHPPFLLPNQNYSQSASTGFLNERGFWALDACRPIGVGPGSECEVDEDCCGGNGAEKTAVCSLDLPVTLPPTRHCKSAPSVNSCTARGSTCTDSGQCCLNDVCVNAECTKPPSISSLSPTNFTRDYRTDCPHGEKAFWRYFDWKAKTPGDSYIEFYAQAVNDPADFETLPPAPTAVESAEVVGVGLVQGPTISSWVGNNVGTLLDAVQLPHGKHLRITMRFMPSSDDEHTPVLTDWRQSYSCLPDE